MHALFERLKLRDLLARGGQSNIYRAMHNERPLVFKCFFNRLDEEHEAQTLLRICHPVIPLIIGRSIEEKYPGLVMEYIPGPSLRCLLNYLADARLFLSMNAVGYLSLSLLSALRVIHAEGIIHN